MDQRRIFSGIQPSGTIHVGNYLGAIQNWTKLQYQCESIFCVVDYHAITVEYDPRELSERVMDVAATLLACGIDPERATLFVQSAVPEHTELSWLLTCITPLGMLERMTQFKDKAARQERGSAGRGTPLLSGVNGRGHPAVQGGLGTGGRRPNPALGAHPRPCAEV